MMTTHKARFSPESRTPIDLVYTYVDEDPAHSEKRQFYLGLAGNAPLKDKDFGTRYSTVGEIGFSVRSALKYMPWLRQIFIVTDSQKPPVDIQLIESGKVTVVDHRDIIPDKYLPTFNSVTIESFLYRIDGLSEIFLYNNDDFMHFSDVPENIFFTTDSDGDVHLELNISFAITRRAMHLASQLCPRTYATMLANPYTIAISNAYQLLRNSGYHLPWNTIIVPRHFTQIYRKITAIRLEEEFTLQLDTNRKLRFRTPELFSYSTLTYTLEKTWNPGDQLNLSKLYGKSGEFGMFDFTAFFVCREKLWQQVASSQAMFACLNNIPQTDINEFERVMCNKGLGKPRNEFVNRSACR